MKIFSNSDKLMSAKLCSVDFTNFNKLFKEFYIALASNSIYAFTTTWCLLELAPTRVFRPTPVFLTYRGLQTTAREASLSLMKK